MIGYTYINKIPSGLVRATAGQVFVLSLVGLLFVPLWIVAFLAADFAVRSLNMPKLSPLAFSARKIFVPLLRLSSEPVSRKPKQFAATLGLIITTSAVILILSGYQYTALVLLAVLACFSLLESAWGFCVGCRIYSGLIRFGLIKDDECQECSASNGLF